MTGTNVYKEHFLKIVMKKINSFIFGIFFIMIILTNISSAQTDTSFPFARVRLSVGESMTVDLLNSPYTVKLDSITGESAIITLTSKGHLKTNTFQIGSAIEAEGIILQLEEIEQGTVRVLLLPLNVCGGTKNPCRIDGVSRIPAIFFYGKKPLVISLDSLSSNNVWLKTQYLTPEGSIHESNYQKEGKFNSLFDLEKRGPVFALKITNISTNSDYKIELIDITPDSVTLGITSPDGHTETNVFSKGFTIEAQGVLVKVEDIQTIPQDALERHPQTQENIFRTSTVSGSITSIQDPDAYLIKFFLIGGKPSETFSFNYNSSFVEFIAGIVVDDEANLEALVVGDEALPNVINSPYVCGGCIKNEIECYPIGYRVEDTYCSESGEFLSQIEEGETCTDVKDYECKTNFCENDSSLDGEGKCISASLFQKFMGFLKNIFS